MKTVIISLGGSLIVPSGVDVSFLRRFRRLVLAEKHRFAIICGGGKTCRTYQKAAQELAEVSKTDLDWIGIESTRLNAEVMRAAFGNQAYEKVIINPKEKIKSRKRILVGAGGEPGWSTDVDAVWLAINLGSKVVVNLSNVEYVFDRDPRVYADAKILPKLRWKDYRKIVGKKWTPGLNTPFDPIASREAEKNKIKVVIMGSDLRNLKNFLEGKKFRGTMIEG